MMKLPHYMKEIEPQHMSTFEVDLADDVLNAQVIGIDLGDMTATFNVNVKDGVAQPMQSILTSNNYRDALVKLQDKAGGVTMVVNIKGLVFELNSLHEAAIKACKLNYGSHDIMQPVTIKWDCDDMRVIPVTT